MREMPRSAATAFKTPCAEYVGHDEPSLAFKSSEPGSGNDSG